MKTETVYYQIVAGPSADEMRQVAKEQCLMFKVMKYRLTQEPNYWEDVLRAPVEVWLKVLDCELNEANYTLKGELPVDAPWGKLRECCAGSLNMVHWCEGETVVAMYDPQTEIGTMGMLLPHIVPLSEAMNVYINIHPDEPLVQTETILDREQAELTVIARKRDEFSAWLWDSWLLPLGLTEAITRAFEELGTVYDVTHELMEELELYEDDEWLEILELQSIVARYLPDEAVDEPDLIEDKLLISLYGEIVDFLMKIQEAAS